MVLSSPGISVTPDCRHIIIRREHPSATKLMRLEKRHIPSMQGCRGNAKDDAELRECPLIGPDYVHYEKRLHTILGPALDSGIIRDIFVSF